jgi:hypothetical protein
MPTHSSRSHGHDGSPLLPLCRTRWIDIVNMCALSPLAVSEVLRGLDGEKPRRLAHRALSQTWVLHSYFGFPLWYK